MAFWNGSLNLGGVLHSFADVQGIVSGMLSQVNRLKHGKFHYGKLFDKNALHSAEFFDPTPSENGLVSEE